MTETPVREKQQTYRCRCVVLPYEGGTDEQGRCQAETGSPDAPFCAVCEDRHPGLDRSEVTIWRGRD